MQPRDEDDTQGKPIFLIRPSENVYSYFMFIGPTESKKTMVRSRENTPRGPQGQPPPDAGWWPPNWDIVMGYLLIFMNFFMQYVLLLLIYEEVVVSNIEWQNGIMKLGDTGDHVMGLIAEKAGECNDGGALCFIDPSGMYSCAPPTVQVVGRWDELDTNKDGTWSRLEVIKAQKELKCKYVVDPVLVFDVMINLLKERADKIWLHPDIKNGVKIHKAYFTYIMADIIMCGYRSEDMCANLLMRGIFDAPFKYGTSPRVGTTIESALKYCHELLRPEGKCERNLPSTYAVWQITSAGECGEPEYSMEKYVMPARNNDTSQVLHVDYAARQEYELAQDLWFCLFKGIVIFLWLLAMSSEIRDVIKILTLCARIPAASEFGEDAVIVERDPSDPEDVRYRIQGITMRHRITMVVLCFLRFAVVCVLSVVGVSYLIKTNSYSDLVMNGVALAFIAEISSVLYDQILRAEIKDQTEDIKPIKVEMYGWRWLNTRPALIDMLCVAGIGIICYLIVTWQMKNVVVPVETALGCTCLGQGDNCFEAQKYNYDWWHDYWLNKVPGVYQEFAKLKMELPADLQAASFIALSSNYSKASSLGKRVLVAKREDHLENTVSFLEEEMDDLVKLSSAERAMETRAVAPASGDLLPETGTQHRSRAVHPSSVAEAKAAAPPHGHLLPETSTQHRTETATQHRTRRDLRRAKARGVNGGAIDAGPRLDHAARPAQ